MYNNLIISYTNSMDAPKYGEIYLHTVSSDRPCNLEGSPNLKIIRCIWDDKQSKALISLMLERSKVISLTKA